MALKAGRVGLNKDLVDDFGYLKEDAPSGEYYTKTQADNKFETKTHVNNNFQKKTLEVPIELLSGSALTVESALQGLNEEKFNRAEQRVLGAKNLLPNNAISQIINGVTFTVNADGSVTANGTASADATLVIINKAQEKLPRNTSLILTGCPSDGGSTKYGLYTRIGLLPSDTYVRNDTDEGSGSEPFILNDDNTFAVNLIVRNGYTANNLVFYPMLRLATDPDDTYVPYAMTNREITEELVVQESVVTSVVTGATVDDTATRLRKVGKFVEFALRLTNVTANAFSSIAVIPDGYRPKGTVYFPAKIVGEDTLYMAQVDTNGAIQFSKNLTANGVIFCQVNWLAK